MSVNINFRPSSNDSKWDAVKNGDFAVLEGNPENPIPQGLYRIFIVSTDGGQIRVWVILPLFDGPFSEGMFPYMVNIPPPKLVQTFNKLHIEVEQ